MSSAVCTGGRKYKVMLVENTSSNVDAYLNNVLLERNLALPDSIELILETMDPICLEGADVSEESDVEPEETHVVKLSDISVSRHPQPNAVLPSSDDSISDDEGYDILVPDPLEFLKEMMRVSGRSGMLAGVAICIS
jgi:antitoxin component HigA of HigAB toxin-antitoxin module